MSEVESDNNLIGGNRFQPGLNKSVPEAVALRLSLADVVAGRRILRERVGNFNVTLIDGDLVYIFSSHLWLELQGKLNNEGVLYQWMSGPGLSDKDLFSPDRWSRSVLE
ncbi:MAG: hypothetical protein M1607_05175 [Patescibacteria group bacterium]|nr:hypothetical protein [Patescibacteria group bacterium]